MSTGIKLYSGLTFNDVAKDLPYIKVYWNGHIVYDDTLTTTIDECCNIFGKEYAETHFGYSGLKYFKAHFSDKYVYQINITIVESHHCILNIIGE